MSQQEEVIDYLVVERTVCLSFQGPVHPVHAVMLVLGLCNLSYE